jgi:soluble lytic murein transglycosylase
LGNWSEVKVAIDAMTPLARAESTWTYWLGRAAQQQGRNDEARQLFVRIAAEHSFYGRLAAEEVGQTLSLPRAAAIEARESQAAANHPRLRRALALFERNMRVEGVREWNWALRGMDDRQLLAAADLARSNKVWDRAINTADRTQQTHDYSLRFLAPYREALGREARAQSVEEPFVLGLVRQESRFIAEVKSGVGAAGLMQLMPATARWVAKRVGMHDFHWSRVTEVDINARLGTYYLRQVLSELDSHPVLASAAYNAGPGRARNWRGDRPLEGAIYAESIPFNETRDYVKKVMSNTVYYAAVLGGEARSLKSRLGTVAARGTPSDQLANKDLP